MNTSRSESNKGTPYRTGGVMRADSEQWRKWLNLTPAERLEAANRLWLQNREISKHAKRNLKLAFRAGAPRV